MSDEQRDGSAPITLISSAGEKKGQIPARSGPHGKEALKESAELELARPSRSTTGDHPVPISPFPDDDHQHISGPTKKKPRPEVEAWAQDLANTGEHNLAALRKASGDGAAVKDKNPAPDVANPASQSQSEGGVPSWDGIESPLHAQPEPLPRPRRAPPTLPSMGVMITGLAVLIAVGVGGFLVFKVVTAPKAELVEAKPPEDDEFVRRMRAQAEGAPECWKTDTGFDFVYKGPKGANQRADRIADVPHLYRRTAQCVREQ
jgi:hypothetical protein